MLLLLCRDDGGFPHYDVPYAGLPPPPVPGALPPPAWMSAAGDSANKGQEALHFLEKLLYLSVLNLIVNCCLIIDVSYLH